MPGVSSAAHATIPGVNLLTSPWAERTRPPRTLCRILCRRCLALRDDPVVEPKLGQTHTRTLQRHRTSSRFSDHALHLPSREVGRSPKPTPIRHVRTHHSRSITTGPGPAPQRVCFKRLLPKGAKAEGRRTRIAFSTRGILPHLPLDNPLFRKGVLLV